MRTVLIVLATLAGLVLLAALLVFGFGAIAQRMFTLESKGPKPPKK